MIVCCLLIMVMGMKVHIVNIGYCCKQNAKGLGLYLLYPKINGLYELCSFWWINALVKYNE